MEGTPSEALPLGKPISQTQLYIVDESGVNHCEPNEEGELCIGGIGLARGYLNREELTQERFCPNPFGEGLIYRTGDLAMVS